MRSERLRRTVVRFPSCRCGFYARDFFQKGGHFALARDQDRTRERGEWTPVPICKKGIGCLYWQAYDYSPLERCAHCRRLGDARRIKYRGDCYLGTGESLDLCMACWNRYRPIVRRILLMRKCQTLVNKIRRKAAQPRK